MDDVKEQFQKLGPFYSLYSTIETKASIILCNRKHRIYQLHSFGTQPKKFKDQPNVSLAD
jgi:hypothetical protein